MHQAIQNEDTNVVVSRVSCVPFIFVGDSPGKTPLEMEETQDLDTPIALRRPKRNHNLPLRFRDVLLQPVPHGSTLPAKLS